MGLVVAGEFQVRRRGDGREAFGLGSETGIALGRGGGGQKQGEECRLSVHC